MVWGGGFGCVAAWVPGCPDAEFEMYVVAPEGYRVVGPDRMKAGGDSDGGKTFEFAFEPLK
jgi:hypothetical protein